MNPVSRVSPSLWHSASGLMQKSAWRAGHAIGELANHSTGDVVDGLLEMERSEKELRLAGVLIQVAKENDDAMLNLLV